MAIVTFTTDFGFADGYVGAMKGVVLSLAPQASLVDITHGITPQDVRAGAVALAQAAPLFPAGTIHVGVVDPGVGTDRADLAVLAAGQVFIGPDNGMLSVAACAPRRAFRIVAAGFRREPVSPTFHGRDVFAPAAGRLAAGARIDEVGPALDAIVEIEPASVRQLDGRADGAVIHVDAFGNLITSIPGDLAGGGHQIELEGVAGTRWRPPLRRTFAEVEPGALVAYVGSAGTLEIAVRNGSASAHTGAGRGSVVRVRGAP